MTITESDPGADVEHLSELIPDDFRHGNSLLLEEQLEDEVIQPFTLEEAIEPTVR